MQSYVLQFQFGLRGGCLTTCPKNPLSGGELSVQAISWVLANSKAKLGARLVLLSIANHARDDGTGAWPSVATIAKEAHLSERQVQYSIHKLQRLGEVQKQEGTGPYGTNMYSMPKMRGAKSAPGGANRNKEGCNPRHEGVQSTSPNPSLTVHKDKRGPKAHYSASDKAYYSKFYREHPELKPAWWEGL